MSECLQVGVEGPVWTFTLNRPDKLNALDAALVEALHEALSQAHRDNARVIVFRGAGRSFCAGFDLSSLEAQSEGDLVLRFARIEMLLQAIARSPAQTVALAHGKVFGAGVDLVAVCRHRVAAADATFRMPGLKFGLVLGTRRFGELVGRQRARELLENTSSFDVASAEAMGFVTRRLEPVAWPEYLDGVRQTSESLDDVTRAELLRVLGPLDADADLASLVRSAARPGLKDRLRHYLGR